MQVPVVEKEAFTMPDLLATTECSSKSVKVSIFALTRNAAVAGHVTARKTFKVLSFFEWMLTVRTNTMYTVYIVVTIVTISILWCPEVHEGMPVCLTDQDQQQGLVFDFPKTLVFFLLQQDRLVFFSSFTHTV